MSLSELFSQRYMARVGCGELFADDLHLHDRKAVREKNDAVHLAEAEAHLSHVEAELALRVQLNKAIASANAKRVTKDLPRRARQIMADAYLQANLSSWSTVIEEAGFENLFSSDGKVTPREPLAGEKWSLQANLFVFDFVEAFFDLLPNEEQLEFSRDLNQRLQRGASRWYFQLGRWRREDWPRERDSQFDQILYSLKKQADLALEAHHNRLLESDGDTVQAEIDAKAASESLMAAARSLWEADRLLASDLLSDKVRHGAAVRSARQALDHCLSHFRGMVTGPFVKAKAPKDGSKRNSPSVSKHVNDPQGAALRLRALADGLLNGHQALDRETRLAMLERANLAEFMTRLVLFGLPEGEAGDIEDAEGDEIRRYSKLSRSRRPLTIYERRYSHADAALPLELTDEAAARLAVDTLARLCQFSTGAASTPGEPGFGADRNPIDPEGLDYIEAEGGVSRQLEWIIPALAFGLPGIVLGGLIGVFLGAGPMSEMVQFLIGG